MDSVEVYVENGTHRHGTAQDRQGIIASSYHNDDTRHRQVGRTVEAAKAGIKELDEEILLLLEGTR